MPVIEICADKSREVYIAWSEGYMVETDLGAWCRFPRGLVSGFS